MIGTYVYNNLYKMLNFENIKNHLYIFKKNINTLKYASHIHLHNSNDHSIKKTPKRERLRYLCYFIYF